MINELQTSIIVSEIKRQSGGQGEPPKVSLKAMSSKLPCIVILSEVVELLSWHQR
jgi:hypothetical protein